MNFEKESHGVLIKSVRTWVLRQRMDNALQKLHTSTNGMWLPILVNIMESSVHCFFFFQINWHRVISFMMFFVCVFGLAIIWMYGLCVMSETKCSYEEHIQTNKTISIIVFVLGCVGLVTSAFGVALIRKFGQGFGLQVIPGQRGGLRYVGFSDDVVSELRRQNAEMQRQLGMQNNYPQLPPGCQGFTNYGFEPPTPPPYSPTAVGVSIIDGTCQPVQNQHTNLNPPKYSDLQPSVFPNEPPPAYKETSGDGDNTENQNERTDM